MPAPCTGHASVSLGATKDIARRLVAQGRFESVSEACREDLRRLEIEQRIVGRLVALGEEGKANGADPLTLGLFPARRGLDWNRRSD